MRARFGVANSINDDNEAKKSNSNARKIRMFSSLRLTDIRIPKAKKLGMGKGEIGLVLVCADKP